MDYREGKKLADEARDASLRLQGQARLSREEESQMITASQACVFIWTRVGTPLQVARAHWVTSRAFCKLEDQKFSLLHAQMCDFYTKQSRDRKDYDEAYAMEALARASALRGDVENGLRLKRDAVALGKKIRDPNDKLEFEKNFLTLSWFQLEGQE
ncbi:MAG: hypothetical protein ACXWC9_02810 [Pseudobdellovibrionaceae bacterium]